MVHSAKPAVGALSEACCTADRGRPFDNVALLDVTVTHLNLQSTESALCRAEGGKPEVDSTGALLELGASELMRQVQGAGAGACPVQRQNVDIMGHQAKGIMAVRLDNDSRALVRRLTVRCLENSSRRTAVVAPNRSAEAAVDSAMGTAFGATYIRGVVVAGVRSACLDTVSLEQLHSPYGVIKGVELLGARDVTVRCVTMRDLSGFYVCGCYIQSSCGNVKVAGLRLDGAVATLPAEFGEWERWLPLRRDPQVLAVEAGAGTVVVTETDQLAEG